MSENWELSAVKTAPPSHPHLPQRKIKKNKACIESQLFTVQLESEQQIVHSQQQTQLERTLLPPPPRPQREKPFTL
jgi:hypothetical protein